MTIMDSKTVADKSKSDTESDDMNNRVIDFIVNHKEAYFKSQQRGEDDLSVSEKRVIVQNLFLSNPPLFLHLYGKYLDAHFLDYLESVFVNDQNSDLEVQFKDLRERIKLKQSAVKNRRYQAMQKLLREGSYFCNSEMQSRNPYLFEQMIGQFMDEKERKELLESSYKLNYDNTNFSSFLMEQMRSIRLKCKYMADENIDTQEEDEDEEEEEDHEDESDEETPNKSTQINPHNKELMEREFRTQMMEDFLMGKDKEFFNYSQVDDNEDYDMNEEFERDQQDRYFEED